MSERKADDGDHKSSEWGGQMWNVVSEFEFQNSGFRVPISGAEGAYE
jgi:hypothetical protein